MNHPGLTLDFFNLRNWGIYAPALPEILDVAEKYIEELEKRVERLDKLEDRLGEMDTPANAVFIDQLKEFKT